MPHSKYIRENYCYSYGTGDELDIDEDVSTRKGVSDRYIMVHDEAVELDVDGVEVFVGTSKHDFDVHKESSEATKNDFKVNKGKHRGNLIAKILEEHQFEIDYIEDEDE